MYSVKPGRGPSAMGAVGAVVAILFGVFWIGVTVRMGAPGIFPLFGVVFILIAVGNFFFNAHNATQPNRFSAFDITTDNEERDPLEPRRGAQSARRRSEKAPNEPTRRYQGDFCPFCGANVEGDFDYCPKCGKDI